MASGATSPTVTPADLPHDTLQPNIIACAAITWVIAATFVGLRFYARKRILNALNSSDWLILVALVRQPSLLAAMLKQTVVNIIS